jgi:hypothetical protein
MLACTHDAACAHTFLHGRVSMYEKFKFFSRSRCFGVVRSVRVIYGMRCVGVLGCLADWYEHSNDGLVWWNRHSMHNTHNHWLSRCQAIFDQLRNYRKKSFHFCARCEAQLVHKLSPLAAREVIHCDLLIAFCAIEMQLWVWDERKSGSVMMVARGLVLEWSRDEPKVKLVDHHRIRFESGWPTLK